MWHNYFCDSFVKKSILVKFTLEKHISPLIPQVSFLEKQWNLLKKLLHVFYEFQRCEEILGLKCNNNPQVANSSICCFKVPKDGNTTQSKPLLGFPFRAWIIYLFLAWITCEINGLERFRFKEKVLNLRTFKVYTHFPLPKELFLKIKYKKLIFSAISWEADGW